ncbi:MAG: HipA domain-containing protein, partial [Arenimonas sp.]|nr:HipA domain-containing protein [Arenimonas sp.]
FTTAVTLPAALEFVRRLALAAITGNGDMHLKNWSLIYREDVVSDNYLGRFTDNYDDRCGRW